jgi:hypothetical protein
MQRFPLADQLGFIIPSGSNTCWSLNTREQEHLAASGYVELHREPFAKDDQGNDMFAVLFCKGEYAVDPKIRAVPMPEMVAHGPVASLPVHDELQGDNDESLTPED